MKIRNGFVSNSSSSSFILCAYDMSDNVDGLKKIFTAYKTKYPEEYAEAEEGVRTDYDSEADENSVEFYVYLVMVLEDQLSRDDEIPFIAKDSDWGSEIYFGSTVDRSYEDTSLMRKSTFDEKAQSIVQRINDFLTDLGLTLEDVGITEEICYVMGSYYDG